MFRQYSVPSGHRQDECDPQGHLFRFLDARPDRQQPVGLVEGSTQSLFDLVTAAVFDEALLSTEHVAHRAREPVKGPRLLLIVYRLVQEHTVCHREESCVLIDERLGEGDRPQHPSVTANMIGSRTTTRLARKQSYSL